MTSLEDLPLSRAASRGISSSNQRWRDQLRQMGDRAGDRLEGWLEEPPWQDDLERSEREPEVMNRPDPLDDWEEGDRLPRREARNRDEDPWV